MQNSDDIKDVRDHYEALPYPPLEPETEKKVLTRTYTDALDIINHYCFEGKENFNDNFRVLVAGGGTGSATVYLAEQLRYKNAEVVHIDISEASIALARQRAALRNLNNITWIHDSLLNIPKLGLGQFDLINSVGVLHHLANPSQGLAALTAVLKSTGAMTLMVYGTYGRNGVYQMQELMRHINGGDEDIQSKLNRCKAILADLGEGHWFNDTQKYINDIKRYADAGIYDLLLHAQDRSYTVPELYEWLAPCDLKLLSFIAQSGQARHIYSPEAYVKDKQLLAEIIKLDNKEQQAVAELHNGHMTKHAFYTALTPRPEPQPTDLENVPIYSSQYFKNNVYETTAQAIEKISDSYVHFNRTGCPTVTVKLNKYTKDIFRHLDGKRTIGELINVIIVEKTRLGEIVPRADELLQEFTVIYREMHYCDRLILRHKSVDPYRSEYEMQDPISAQYVHEKTAT